MSPQAIGSFPVWVAASRMTAHLRPTCGHLRVHPADSPTMLSAYPAVNNGNAYVEIPTEHLTIPLCRFCMRSERMETANG